jgi:hypothetical protein
MLLLASDVRRFWAKVLKTDAFSDGDDSCWLWTGHCDKDGFGQFGINAATVKSHRVSYELAYGPIPEGLQVRHTCEVPDCVRPSHLLVGTQKGSAHGSAKLTEADIPVIRARAEHETLKAIAADYSVLYTSIWNVVHRKTWKHIK